MKIISAEVRHLEPVKTIAVKHTGDYYGIGQAFDKLAGWADANNLWEGSPKLAAIYFDDPSTIPAEELRSLACLENIPGVAAPEGMEDYTISGGKYFVMQIELTMPEYGQAWQEAYAAVAQKGFECDMRDHYELYVTCCNPDDINASSVVDLCIPVK